MIAAEPSGADRLSLCVVILTYNEALHIGRALASVSSIAEKVFVIDSGSKDDTVAIARAHGAEVLTHPFVNQAQQFQWAMDTCDIRSQWVLRLDADEIIEADLAARLGEELPRLPAHVAGVKLNRKHIFLGRWIRHGGRYPLTMLRVWRNGMARIENRWMDEHIYLLQGEAVTIEGGFADANMHDIAFFIDKHNKYATREAVDVLGKRYGLFSADPGVADDQGGQARRKRLLKEKLYNNLPFGTGPVLYFLFRYFIQMGFLDGREGAIYHGLQGLWYRFLVDARILEIDRELRPLTTVPDKLQRLTELTGYTFAQAQ